MKLSNPKNVVAEVNKLRCSRHSIGVRLKYRTQSNGEIRYFTDDLCCSNFQKKVSDAIVDAITDDAANNVIDEIQGIFDGKR